MRNLFVKSRKSIAILATVAALGSAAALQPKEVQAADPFIAEIIMFGGNFNPRGWAFCDGQLLPIAQNTALFSLLGTTFGGDGRTNFALPDLRGRVAMHPGSGAGLTPRSLGEKGGTETNTLSVLNLPAHNHAATLHASSGAGNVPDPAGSVLAKKNRTNIYNNSATPDVTMNSASVTTANTGGGQAVNNVQPFLAVNYIIALTGTFPSRN
jgi:microcystin-dependent protein